MCNLPFHSLTMSPRRAQRTSPLPKSWEIPQWGEHQRLRCRHCYLEAGATDGSHSSHGVPGFSGGGRKPGQQRPRSSFSIAEVEAEGRILPVPSLGICDFNEANEIFQPRALNLLSDVSFANIFSQSVPCFLILLTLSFAEQKLFILMKSSLSIISFMDRAFGVISKMSSPMTRSSRFSPTLSSRSFVFYI